MAWRWIGVGWSKPASARRRMRAFPRRRSARRGRRRSRGARAGYPRAPHADLVFLRRTLPPPPGGIARRAARAASAARFVPSASARFVPSASRAARTLLLLRRGGELAAAEHVDGAVVFVVVRAVAREGPSRARASRGQPWRASSRTPPSRSAPRPAPRRAARGRAGGSSPSVGGASPPRPPPPPNSAISGRWRLPSNFTPPVSSAKASAIFALAADDIPAVVPERTLAPPPRASR